MAASFNAGPAFDLAVGRTWEQRVEAYVDSPLMTQRLRLGPGIAAMVRGSLGTYRVHAEWDSTGSDCTCPSERRPCKHVEAMRRTFKVAPGTFPVIDEVLEQHLDGMDREELVQVLRGMIMEAPASLAALGVMGFLDYFVTEGLDDW